MFTFPSFSFLSKSPPQSSSLHCPILFNKFYAAPPHPHRVLVPCFWTVPYSTQDDDCETGTKQMDLSNQLHCFGLAVIYHLDTNLNPCPDLCLRTCNETSTFLRPDHIPSRQPTTRATLPHTEALSFPRWRALLTKIQQKRTKQ